MVQIILFSDVSDLMYLIPCARSRPLSIRQSCTVVLGKMVEVVSDQSFVASRSLLKVSHLSYRISTAIPRRRLDGLAMICSCQSPDAPRPPQIPRFSRMQEVEPDFIAYYHLNSSSLLLAVRRIANPFRDIKDLCLWTYDVDTNFQVGLGFEIGICDYCSASRF